MKLLVFGDLQATEGDERCFSNPAVSLQHFRVKKFFDILLAVYKQHGCEGLIDLGDTTDDRSAIPVTVIDAVIAGIEAFPITDSNFKIMGNHEQFLRDTSVDSGRMFSSHFRVVHSKALLEIDDTVYFFTSYPASHEKLAEWLDHYSLKYKAKTKILFGHFQVVGATLGNGEAVTGIPRKIMDRFEVSLLGHIHLPHSLGNRIHYVGSPFQQDWGEAGQDKRVGVLDTNTLKITWVPITGFPVYRYGYLEEFLATFDPEKEDRWKVVLKNHTETEQFYAFPYSNRFEAVYDYKDEGDTTKPEKVVHDWSFDSSLAHWVKTVSPGSHGIDIPATDLIEIGSAIAKGDTLERT